MSLPEIFFYDWIQIPFDIITLISQYLSAHDLLNLCIRNDSFNRKVFATENQDSIIWKLLYQRDISKTVPRDHVAFRYLDIMDHILSSTPNGRIFYGADHGYNEIIKSAIKDSSRCGNINAGNNYALRLAASNGNTETVGLLLDQGVDIHADNQDFRASLCSRVRTYRDSEIIVGSRCGYSCFG